jgi:hypothetical protein
MVNRWLVLIFNQWWINGIVVWEEASEAKTKGVPITVKSADLATGQIKTLAGLGRRPAISYPYLAWVEGLEDQPSTQLPGAFKGVLIVQNLQTGTKKTLQKVDTPYYFSLYKETIVWITAEGKQVILTDVNESYQKVIAEAQGIDLLEFPTIGERLVTWRSRETSQVWDRKQQRLVRLMDRRGANFHTNGKAFYWIEPVSDEQYNKDKGEGLSSNGQIIHFIDTSNLP